MDRFFSATKFPKPFTIENALRLVVGATLEDTQKWRMRDLSALQNGKISMRWEKLQNCADPKYPIVALASNRLKNILWGTENLCDSPLEAAYSFTLPCFAAISGTLNIGVSNFKVARNGQVGLMF